MHTPRRDIIDTQAVGEVKENGTPALLECSIPGQNIGNVKRSNTIDFQEIHAPGSKLFSPAINVRLCPRFTVVDIVHYFVAVVVIYLELTGIGNLVSSIISADDLRLVLDGCHWNTGR